MGLDPSRFSRPAAWLFRLWCRSLRLSHEGVERAEAVARTSPLVVALWHNELFAMTPLTWRTSLRYCTIVSQSKDGELLARILNSVGVMTARGSSSKGGMRALVQIQRMMRDHQRTPVVTVDGPRGPRHKAKEGILYLASKSNAQVVPVRIWTPTAWVFRRAWDRFRLPKPWSRVHVRVGQPYPLSGDVADPQIMAQEVLRLETVLAELGRDMPI